MTLFTSRRERRLWGWAGAALLAIYATVGLAGTLTRFLGEHDLVGAVFGLAFLIVIAAVVGIALHTRPSVMEVWIGIGVAAAYSMVIVRMAVTPIERTHLFEYGLLAVLIHRALLERRAGGRSVRAPAVIAIVTAALLGWGDEALQAVLPSRVYDLRDVLVNGLAALIATLASVALTWARSRRTSAARRTPE